MTFRQVQDSDFGFLAELYVVAYNSLHIGEQWDAVSAEKLLGHLYAAQPDLFFVAESDHVLVGAITAIIKPWWDGNHLTDGELFVNPAEQGQGIGKQLIQYLFTQAQQKYQAVSWDTFTHVVHEHPLKWYKKMGFKEIKEWTMITGDVATVLNNLKTRV